MTLKALVFASMTMTSALASAASVEITSGPGDAISAGALEYASQVIAERCPNAATKSSLKLVSVDSKTVKVDQGVIDVVYTLNIEVPNSTNDNDEDGFELVITEAALSNPAISPYTLESYYAYGLTCQ